MVLKINCEDTKGLIFNVTKCLYESKVNIVRNDEYVDKETERFFMRTEFDGEIDTEDLRQKLKSTLPAGAKIDISKTSRQKIILMASKEPHCLTDIVHRCEFDDLSADILSIISNHRILQKTADRYNIPYHFIDHRKYNRKEHESEVLKIIDQYAPDYIILAKYMRILSPEFVHRYKNRLINIHHSFLPAFKGARPYQQAFMRGVKVIGASAHFVNEDLDEGPIIEQDTIRVDHGYSPMEMAKAGKDVERIVLAKALDLVFQQRVFIHGNKTIVF